MRHSTTVVRGDVVPETDDQTLDPFYWMRSNPFPARWLRSILLRIGIGYVTWTGEDKQLWAAAVRNAFMMFRRLGRSLSFADLDSRYSHFDQWIEAREKYQGGDKIWPFVINPNTMEMRAGFVIVRGRLPVTGIVTTVS